MSSQFLNGSYTHYLIICDARGKVPYDIVIDNQRPIRISLECKFLQGRGLGRPCSLLLPSCLNIKFRVTTHGLFASWVNKWLCQSFQPSLFNFPGAPLTLPSSHTEHMQVRKVKEAFSQACSFYTCSFLSLKWTLPPLPSTGPLHVSLDIQGCGGQICKLLTRQEWPAQGAARSTNICLGCLPGCALWHGAAICPEKKGKRHLFSNVQEGCRGPVDTSSSRGLLPIPQSSLGPTHNVWSCLFSPWGCEFFHCRAVLLVVSSIRTVPGPPSGFKKCLLNDWMNNDWALEKEAFCKVTQPGIGRAGSRPPDLLESSRELPSTVEALLLNIPSRSQAFRDTLVSSEDKPEELN